MKNFKETIITSITIAMLLLVSTFKADAQKVVFGLRFMPTISNFKVNTSTGGTTSGKAKIGFGAGVILGYNFSNMVGVQGEVIYSSISQKYTEASVERDVNLRYVNVPILLSLNTGKTNMVNLNLVIGPQVGISVGSSLTTTGSDGSGNQPVLSVKKGDLGFAYGAGLDFGLNSAHTIRLDLGFRGVYGLFDISDNNRTLTTNNYYLLNRSHIKTYSIYTGVSFLF